MRFNILLEGTNFNNAAEIINNIKTNQLTISKFSGKAFTAKLTPGLEKTVLTSLANFIEAIKRFNPSVVKDAVKLAFSKTNSDPSDVNYVLNPDPYVAYFKYRNTRNKPIEITNLFTEFEKDARNDREFEKKVLEFYDNSSKAKMSQNDIEMIYDENGWKVFIPKTFGAASKLSRLNGKKIPWCTAADEDMFIHYTKRGPLYCFINEGKSLAFQFNGKTKAMDKKDKYFEAIDFKDKEDEPRETDTNDEIVKTVFENIPRNVLERIFGTTVADNYIKAKAKAGKPEEFPEVVFNGNKKDENGKEFHIKEYRIKSNAQLETLLGLYHLKPHSREADQKYGTIFKAPVGNRNPVGGNFYEIHKDNVFYVGYTKNKRIEFFRKAGDIFRGVPIDDAVKLRKLTSDKSIERKKAAIQQMRQERFDLGTIKLTFERARSSQAVPVTRVDFNVEQKIYDATMDPHTCTRVMFIVQSTGDIIVKFGSIELYNDNFNNFVENNKALWLKLKPLKLIQEGVIKLGKRKYIETGKGTRHVTDEERERMRNDFEWEFDDSEEIERKKTLKNLREEILRRIKII
jgi:hypothetical protein